MNDTKDGFCIYDPATGSSYFARGELPLITHTHCLKQDNAQRGYTMCINNVDNLPHKHRNKEDGHVVDPPFKHTMRIPKPRPKDPSNFVLNVLARFEVDLPCK